MSHVADAGWEHFEVEADVGVRAWGPTQADAFAQVALGTLALIVPPEDVTERDHREVRAQGDSRETLLVNWVNECLYVHEIEGFVVHRVEVDSSDEGLVHGVLHGEELDRARHRLGTVVKAATSHGVAVEAREQGWQARLVVDV
jgi:tRNA nucleotidyltransferase (CCA-adding enzyme)